MNRIYYLSLYWGDHILLKNDLVIPYPANLTKFKFQPWLQRVLLHMHFSNGQEIELYDALEALINLIIFRKFSNGPMHGYPIWPDGRQTEL